MSLDLDAILCGDKEDLIAAIDTAAEVALNEGWRITKKAQNEKDPIKQRELIKQAENAYTTHSPLICWGLLSDSIPPETKRGELKPYVIHAIKEFTNIMDIWRRGNMLAKAREIGEKLQKNAAIIGDAQLKLRVGERLSLVQSAEGYALFAQKDYSGALEKFRALERTFNEMPIEDAEAQIAIRTYALKGGNYLTIARTSMRWLGAQVNDLEEELASAEESFNTAIECLNHSGEQDRATWESNIYADIGLIAEFRGDLHKAIKHYRDSLKTSKQGADYDMQVAVLQLYLSRALAKKAEPEDIQEAGSLFSAVEKYDSEHSPNSWASDEPLIRPIVEETSALIYQQE